VTFVTGPASFERPEGCKIIEVETAKDMLGAVNASLPADVAICVAAVADWAVAGATDQKLKKTKTGLPQLSFVENPDILAQVSQAKNRPELVVGFAAETQDVLENAQAKLARKGCDWIVANDVSHKTGIMGGAENEVSIISKAGVENLPRMSKVALGRELARKIADALT